MKVNDVRVCLDCDEVFSDELDCCPGCGSCTSVYLANWLAPLPTKEDLNREIRIHSLARNLDTIMLQAKGLLRFAPDEEPIGVGA